MKVLRKLGINFTELFNNPSLQAGEDLTEYINKLEKLYYINHNLFIDDDDDNIDYKSRFEESKKVNYTPIGFPTLERINTDI